jgi:putative transposase
VRQYTPSEVEKLIHEEVEVSLESLLRTGARRLLQAALEWEVEEYIQRFKHEQDTQGERLVVRNGYHTPRKLQTGVGNIPIRQPRIDDRREGQQFSSAILPKYMRRTPSIHALIPALYLKGVSTSSFPEALQSILGENAPGLSPGNIVRLKELWHEEYEAWKHRDLSGKQYIYMYGRMESISPSAWSRIGPVFWCCRGDPRWEEGVDRH